MTSETVKRIARECGFELAGVAAATHADDFEKYEQWLERGFAGEMRYLTDHRAQIRRDPRSLVPNARTVISVGKLYNTSPHNTSREHHDAGISRYAWGQDYHDVVRASLEKMAQRLTALEAFDFKICVDSAPLLERSYARLAGLGWIGKNTCLINEPLGSWFFLGEIVTSLELELDAPPPDRCGTCTRCIDACPTEAIIQEGDRWTIDSRLCIAYLTIELRGAIPPELGEQIGGHVFGCDICQEVCPWNSRAPITVEPGFRARPLPSLENLAAMSQEEFRDFARGTPLARPKYDGFMRNVRIAIKNKNGRDSHANGNPAQ